MKCEDILNKVVNEVGAKNIDNFISNSKELRGKNASLVQPIKEVCEWDYFPNGESSTQCGNLNVFMDSDFKYCPYCGKPIKIKDHV